MLHSRIPINGGMKRPSHMAGVGIFLGKNCRDLTVDLSVNGGPSFSLENHSLQFTGTFQEDYITQHDPQMYTVYHIYQM